MARMKGWAMINTGSLPGQSTAHKRKAMVNHTFAWTWGNLPEFNYCNKGNIKHIPISSQDGKRTRTSFLSETDNLYFPKAIFY